MSFEEFAYIKMIIFKKIFEKKNNKLKGNILLSNEFIHESKEIQILF